MIAQQTPKPATMADKIFAAWLNVSGDTVLCLANILDTVYGIQQVDTFQPDGSTGNMEVVPKKVKNLRTGDSIVFDDNSGLTIESQGLTVIYNVTKSGGDIKK